MCLFPVRAEPQEFGRPKMDSEGSLMLPCGKCIECKSKRAVEWATRCRHEIACHDENCFITLTYDDDNLPSKLIVKEYFQKFMKRLRKKLKKKVKYIVSHEYGGKTGRPHHHAIIFGWNPEQQEFLREAPSGEPLFISPDLESLWPYGYHSIGTANEKTAYYIAAYSLKSSKHVISTDSGELVEVTDSMDSSRATAIGYEYFYRNVEQLVDSGELLPRYYIKLLERSYPELLEVYQNESMLRQNKARSAHEKLAKFVVTKQKEEFTRDGLRAAPREHYKNKQYENHLKHERDSFKHMIDKRR